MNTDLKIENIILSYKYQRQQPNNWDMGGNRYAIENDKIIHNVTQWKNGNIRINGYRKKRKYYEQESMIYDTGIINIVPGTVDLLISIMLRSHE